MTVKWGQVLAATLVIFPLWGQANPGSHTNTDIVVPVPPQVIWGNGNHSGQQNNAQQCIRCCTYQNTQYSEGAVIKMEGVLLQCSEDKQRLSTNNLVWRMVK
ncbi:hypothetical protein AU512_10945 [Lonsdalea iberica]|uniref:DUF1496 domain-containing protein n=1 Tax=Lonsdalea iberica TaxID=1082703 RepID=A0A1X3RXT6_9GAMM|nr:DUF1496 domain-containing protein [Lonsdalea iberica]OSN06861.1 hypothetical protein AU511_06310 [Lonsdalea iberica]OSN09956.1 hypothetical protein AU512_10945 [Lonsdalea iberica]